MNFHIHYLDILLLYAGWIPMLVFIATNKYYFFQGAIVMMITEVLFSLELINNYSILGKFQFVHDVLIGIFLGIAVFVLELLIGRGKIAESKDRTKMILKPEEVVIIMVIPITEEIFFRIAVEQWLMKKQIDNINFSLVFVFVSALVVVINHYQCFKDKTIFLQKFLVEGILLSSVYITSRRIWQIVIAHMILNFFNVKSYYIVRRNNEANRNKKFINEDKKKKYFG